MLDDFFARALLAAVGLALIAAPAGCVLLWQRSAYFGETMAHSALFGVAVGLFLNLPPEATVFATALLVALALYALRRISGLAVDTLLGVLAPSALALGLVFASLSEERQRYELSGLLFGDVLAISVADLAVIAALAVVAALVLLWVWRALVASTLSPDLAAAEGQRPQRAQLAFTIVVAGIVTIGVKVVGVLLVVALMLIPAATARNIAQTPEQMAWLGAALGAVAAVLGLHVSLWLDVPAGPTIVVTALLMFLLSLARPRSGSRRA